MDGLTDGRDGRTGGRTDGAVLICLPKFLRGHKNMKIIISPYPQNEILSWFNIYLIFKISYKTNDFPCKCGRRGSGTGSMGKLEPVSLAIVRKNCTRLLLERQNVSVGGWTVADLITQPFHHSQAKL